MQHLAELLRSVVFAVYDDQVLRCTYYGLLNNVKIY